MKKQLTTYPLRLPASLKAAVAEISKADGTSINQFVATAVAEKVSALRTAEFFAGRADRADPEDWLGGRETCPAGGRRKDATEDGDAVGAHGDGSGARGRPDRPC